MVLLEVGRIVRPHGVKGEVIVDLVTNRVERLAPGTVLESDHGDLIIADASPHQHRWIVKFEGLDRRDEAERLRGAALRAEPLDEPDTLWVHELVGAEVVGRGSTYYGTVSTIEANPASDILVLSKGGLVPLRFVVSHAPDVVVINPPPGLVDPVSVDPVELVEHDPGWSARFEAEATRLRSALSAAAVRIDHVGSTAVPGLEAKPVIDIQVSVASLEPMDPYRPPLEALGYVFLPIGEGPIGEGWERYPFFGWPVVPPRAVHVHACEAGSDEERRHFAFRDRLRADGAARDAYAALKRELAVRFRHDREAYAEAKREFCEQYS